MRVLISAGLFYPSKLGGPANTLYWLSKALVKCGIDVTVVTSSNHIESDILEFDKWIELDKIRIRYCTVKSKLPLNIVLHSIREIRKSDIVLLSSICYLPNFFILLVSLLLRKRIVWSPRGELFDYALENNKYKLIYFGVIKFLIGQKVTFHATSEEEQQEIIKYFPKSPIVVLPNYMELPLKLVHNKQELPYFLYVGRIAPIKSLDTLILGLANSKFFIKSNYIFKIVGDVEERFKYYYDNLTKLIQDNGLAEKILFVGPKHGSEKYQYYADAYFSFLVSNSENFGNVVIEALSQGTPVVASEGTPWKSLNDYQAGYWIKNDADTIASCVDNLLRLDDEEYKYYRTNAYLLSKQFDVNSNVVKWKSVLENI